MCLVLDSLVLESLFDLTDLDRDDTLDKDLDDLTEGEAGGETGDRYELEVEAGGWEEAAWDEAALECAMEAGDVCDE